MQHDNYLVIIYIDIGILCNRQPYSLSISVVTEKSIDTENNWFAVVCLVKMTMSSDEVDMLTSLHFQSKLPQAATLHFMLKSDGHDCSWGVHNFI